MEIRPLSTELLEKARRELNEEPARIKEVYDHIMEWLRKQPHLNVRLDHQFMVAFFRGCKWNLQHIKEKLDTFYTIKNFVPEFFGNRDPFSKEVQNVLKSRVFFPLPKTENSLDPRICILTLQYANINEAPFTEMMKVFFMTLDVLMKEDDDYVISGIIVLADHEHFPLSYFLQYTPTIIRKYVQCVQNAYPLRLKQFACFNSPLYFESIYNLVKPFVTSKLQQRFSMLCPESTNTFLSDFPKHLLPIEYGGTNGSMTDAADKWKKKLETYRDWFLEDKKYISNEKLRIGKLKLFEDEFGVDGCFRKMDID